MVPSQFQQTIWPNRLTSIYFTHTDESSISKLPYYCSFFYLYLYVYVTITGSINMHVQVVVKTDLANHKPFTSMSKRSSTCNYQCINDFISIPQFKK